MKYLALGAAVAVLVAASVFALRPDSTDVRSPREVIGAFVYHLDKGNFGKACGLMTDEFRGYVEDCSSGFIYNAGIGMAFSGVDIYDGASLLPGVEEFTDGKSFAYRIKTTALPPVEVLVVKQESGRYRIARIG